MSLRSFDWRPAWWRVVSPRTLRADLAAGLLGAVLVLPQGVAFATLAGLPPQYGIHAAIVPCIVAALAGSSWHVMSGPTNANSLALYAMLSPLAVAGSPPYVQLALAATVLVGLMQFAIAALRLGMLADFISPSVLLGFMSGAAVLIAVFALKDLLGLAVPPGTSAVGVLRAVAEHPRDVNAAAVLVGAVTIAATLAARRLERRLPFMLIGLAAGFAAAWALDARGGAPVPVVGAIPSVVPPFAVPDVSWDALGRLVGIAGALTIVALGQSISIAKAVAARSGQRIDANREFLGQGLSNIAGGFFSSYVSCGSLNRSMPNFEAGAKTPLAAVFSALLLLGLAGASAPWLSRIPLAAIASMLLVVAWGLLDRARIARLARLSRVEFAIMAGTFAATLVTRLEVAVLAGTAGALVAYLYRTSRPAIRPLVPDADDPGRRFTPLDELARPQPECPQLKLVRIEGALYFGATTFVADRLHAFRAERPEQKRLLAMTKSMNFIDLAAADLWEAELAERRAMGGDLYFHRPRSQVLRTWRKTGFLDELGDGHVFPTKQVAIGAIYRELDPAICARCEARVFVECVERQRAADAMGAAGISGATAAMAATTAAASAVAAGRQP